MVTAAHVVEPILPGARDSYINLGQFYDNARLEKRRSALNELTGRYKNAYKDAYNYLAAAGALKAISTDRASDEIIGDAVNNCLSILPVSAADYGEKRRCFIDAFCGDGRLSLLKNFENWNIFTINASETDGSRVLSILSNTLADNSFNTFIAYSSFATDLIRHLIIPCHKFVFTLERIPECTCVAAISYSNNSAKQICQHDNLILCAKEMLAAAKCAHDALEEVYNPCVDFTAIQAEARKHINAIL